MGQVCIKGTFRVIFSRYLRYAAYYVRNGCHEVDRKPDRRVLPAFVRGRQETLWVLPAGFTRDILGMVAIIARFTLGIAACRPFRR